MCSKGEIDKLPRCWSEGLEFVKGNLIYSPNAPCYKCLCDENFDNKTEISKNPNCKPVECGIELHQLSYLQLGCVPVYFDDGLCCPFEFRCRSYFFVFFFLPWFIQHEFLLIFFWNFELNVWYFPSIANENDTIEPGNRAKSEHTCKYGNFTLNIGDRIKTTDPCLECSCETPPFALCTRIITTESCH